MGPKPYVAKAVPQLTRQDFELIASVVKNLENFQMTRGGIAEAFADILSETNRNFDRDRFIKACLRRERKPKKGEWNHG